MKKLLSLLATTTLVASTSVTVVACGNPTDTVDPSVPEPDLTDLIADFKKDIDIIIDDYWKEINSYFFALTTEEEHHYEILTEKKIKELVDQNGGEPVTELSDPLDEQSLQADISKVIQIEKLKEKLYAEIDNEKYAILIGDLNDWFTGFSIEWDTLEINYTNDQVSSSSVKEDESFLSYVKVDLNFNFKYLDENGEEQSFSTPQKFIFTLTSNGVLIEAIKNLETNIKADYFLSGGEYSFLDMADFGLESNSELGSIFGTKYLDFKTIYESENFQSNIIDFMTDKYFSELGDIPLEFEGEIIYDGFLTKDYLKAENRIDYDVNNSEGKDLYNSIFNNITENETATIFSLADQEINLEIYTFLQNNYLNFYNSYNEKLNNFVDDLESESESETKIESNTELALENSITYGEVKLKGLTIQIGESYDHPINDLSIYSSIAVKNDETKESREDVRKSNLFGAIYYNTIQGIKAYQDVFGIVDRDTSTNGVPSPIVRFTGQNKNNPDPLANIWNNPSFSGTGNQFYTSLNQSLSLSKSALIKDRDSLLETGYQNKYSWSVLDDDRDESGFSMFGKTDKGMTLSNYTYAGEEYQYINFEQNFIKINFKISGIWRSKGSVLFEKVKI